MQEDDEPKNVKDIVVEMKDISELIVDLAYSSILFNSKEMASEVENLMERASELKYRARQIALLASRTSKDAEQLSGILQIVNTTEDIARAAYNMTTLLDLNLNTGAILNFLFKEADEKINTIVIPEDSPVINKRIGNMHTESEMGVRVIAIKRGRTWIYDPEEDIRIKPKDVFILSGTEDGYKHFRDMILVNGK